jgi:hypothetical protein
MGTKACLHRRREREKRHAQFLGTAVAWKDRALQRRRRLRQDSCAQSVRSCVRACDYDENSAARRVRWQREEAARTAPVKDGCGFRGFPFRSPPGPINAYSRWNRRQITLHVCGGNDRALPALESTVFATNLAHSATPDSPLPNI